MREYPKELFEVKLDVANELVAIRWKAGNVTSAWFAAEGEYSVFEWVQKLQNIMISASASNVISTHPNKYVSTFLEWKAEQARHLFISYHYFAIWNQEREAWSREQFGNSAERSAVGPAKHMVKEANELIEALTRGDIEHAKCEAIDMVFLAFDVCQRLGMEIQEITGRANVKLAINKAREWPKTSSTEPVEYKREPS